MKVECAGKSRRKDKRTWIDASLVRVKDNVPGQVVDPAHVPRLGVDEALVARLQVMDHVENGGVLRTAVASDEEGTRNTPQTFLFEEERTCAHQSTHKKGAQKKKRHIEDAAELAGASVGRQEAGGPVVGANDAGEHAQLAQCLQGALGQERNGLKLMLGAPRVVLHRTTDTPTPKGGRK